MTREQRVELYQRLAPSAHYDSHQLALLCGVCPRHLRRLFQRDLGQTPQRWLNQQRMLAAAHELLKSEPIRIKEVACGLEFVHASAFSRQFRQCFGFPPATLLAQRPLLGKMSAVVN